MHKEELAADLEVGCGIEPKSQATYGLVHM